MRLKIERDANAVTINGRTHIVDCSLVQPEILIVDWFDDHGDIQYRDGTKTGIGDISRFRGVIDLWNEAQLALRTR